MKIIHRDTGETREVPIENPINAKLLSLLDEIKEEAAKTWVFTDVHAAILDIGERLYMDYITKHHLDFVVWDWSAT